MLGWTRPDDMLVGVVGARTGRSNRNFMTSPGLTPRSSSALSAATSATAGQGRHDVARRRDVGDEYAGRQSGCTLTLPRDGFDKDPDLVGSSSAEEDS